MSTKIAKIVAKTKKHDQFQIIRFGQLKLVKGLECENVQCLHYSSSTSIPTLILQIQPDAILVLVVYQGTRLPDYPRVPGHFSTTRN